IPSSDSPNFYRIGEETPRKVWLDYLMGVTWLLRAKEFPIRGFDVFVQSTVPLGSGLSSSAALEVALMKALRSAFRLDINDLNLAQFCQEVENKFVGAHVGIMDPLACAVADESSALFIDTRNLSFRKIALEQRYFELGVVNSGISHKN